MAAYKAKDKKEKVKTINLGKGLNSALARRVEELQTTTSGRMPRLDDLHQISTGYHEEHWQTHRQTSRSDKMAGRGRTIQNLGTSTRRTCRLRQISAA